MGTTQQILRIGVAALLAVGVVAGPLAQAGSPDGPVTIKLAPQSQNGSFTPKSGARLSDHDGLGLTDGEVLISPFTLRTVIGGDTVEVSVPELRVDQLLWVADPLGCMDDDPKTKCHPTWGVEYSGQADADVPVYVEFADGGIGYSDYGVLSLMLLVTVIDEKVRSIEGAVQVTYSTATDLPNYRIPVAGKLK
jgi:hypothetical protein